MWLLSSLPRISSMFANQCSLSDAFLWRSRTVYRTVQRTRSVSVNVIYCCTGWKKRYSSSRECTEGKLKSIHYSLYLMYYFLVVSLNFLWELPDYRVLSYYWLNAEAGNATLKSQIEREYSTSWRVSRHKTHNLISLGCQPVSGCFTKRTRRSLVLLIKTSCCIGHIGRINIAWYLTHWLRPVYPVTQR